MIHDTTTATPASSSSSAAAATQQAAPASFSPTAQNSSTTATTTSSHEKQLPQTQQSQQYHQLLTRIRAEPQRRPVQPYHHSVFVGGGHFVCLDLTRTNHYDTISWLVGGRGKTEVIEATFVGILLYRDAARHRILLSLQCRGKSLQIHSNFPGIKEEEEIISGNRDLRKKSFSHSIPARERINNKVGTLEGGSGRH